MSDEWRGMKNDAISFVPESLLEDLLFVLLVKELRVDDDDPLKRIEEIGKRGRGGCKEYISEILT